MDVRHSTGTCPECNCYTTLFRHNAQDRCYECIQTKLQYRHTGYCKQCQGFEPFRYDADVTDQCIPCERGERRVCNTCLECLPLETHFHVTRSSYKGRSARCKACKRDWANSSEGKASVHRTASKRQQRIEAQATGVPVVEADILTECGHQCCYCGGPYQALDHMWPISKGGSHDPSNLVPACQSCNSSKGRKHLLDFVWKVLVPEGIAP
jgi:5-methylcytosine-specific restriction endonuclease McrA